MKDHVQITMGMDIAALRKSMDAAKALVEQAVATMKKTFLALAGVMGVAFGFKAIAEGIGAAVRRGKELDMLARETGRTAEEIALLTEVVHRAELSMADAADIAKTLGENWREAQLGATQFAGQLNILGLSTEKLAKMATAEQFATIAGAINKLRDPVMRAKLAYDLLGSSGQKAVANFQNGDLERAARLLGKNAMDLAGAAKVMARINDAWSRIKKSGEAFFNQIAGKIAPYLERAASFIEETLVPAAVAFGEKIGNAMKYVLDVIQGAFASGKVGELLSQSLQTGIAAGIDYLVSGFAYAFEIAGKLFKQIWDFTELGTGLMLVMGGAAAAFATGIIKALDIAITGLLSLLEYGFQEIVSGLLEKVGLSDLFAKSSLEDIHKRRKQDSEIGGLGALAKRTGEGAQVGLREGMKELLAGIPKAAKTMQEILAQTDFKNINLMGSKEKMDALGKLAAELAKVGAKIAADAEKKVKAAAVRPGGDKGPTVKGMLGGEGSYDEFRRVGGGVSGAITNIQQKMYDKLAAIANSAAQQVTATQQLVSRFNGGSPSTEMRGVR